MPTPDPMDSTPKRSTMNKPTGDLLTDQLAFSEYMKATPVREIILADILTPMYPTGLHCFCN